ncbi:(d)CMP kinase [Puniceicoccus vermicola]|uniref:Cytidylate kinase n=1 Tax=Puniceicoccus vermicola TaxID=388746 RepID=A0A7X1AWP2_9BACT|nr:(d)CMP kinase [Puniceicoccus vermicola]MBC2601390.1 (d)CMP kinase [Puniceicoccus vermicola]
MSEPVSDSATDFPIITLDGGAATGKSSTARGVSQQLRFLHADTGSHYRALTFLLLRKGISPEESDELTEALEEMKLSAEVDGTLASLIADGKKLSPEDLRSLEVNRNVSSFAALPPVRNRLLRYQRWHRELALEKGFLGLVIEGRDIGSVVFPEAPFRFFLEADESTRIQRRSEEGQEDSVAARDKADSGRKTAPLHCPEGAIRINTGNYTLEEVISQICQKVQNDSDALQ